MHAGVPRFGPVACGNHTNMKTVPNGPQPPDKPLDEQERPADFRDNDGPVEFRDEDWPVDFRDEERAADGDRDDIPNRDDRSG